MTLGHIIIALFVIFLIREAWGVAFPDGPTDQPRDDDKE